MKAVSSLLLVAPVLFGLTPSPCHSEEKPWAWRGQTLTEFAPGETNGVEWQVVNDGVMGGLSQSRFVTTEEGTLKFSGTLSLENNGGFASVRSTAVDRNLSNDLGILLRVKGDGREYNFRLESDATYRGMPVSFSGTFQTANGEWQQVKIPFSSFEGGWRGRDLPDKVLNPADIRRIGVLLGDKKSGPFELEIDYIRTYGKDQGTYRDRDSQPAPELSKKEGPQSLIATAVADGRFTTLKAALDAAGLTTFFQWDNKLTVFAPTDEAFAKLPEGTLEDLLKPENKEKLVSILSYHVHPGEIDLASALKADGVKTVEGTPLEVEFTGGRVRVDDALLVDADIECADGIIHVIDTVLLPGPKRKTLISTAEKAGSFSTLLVAAKAAGLLPVLEGTDPLTLFAPTDEAFAALPDGTVESLLEEKNREKLKDLLTAHVVAGNVSAGDALNLETTEAVNGSPLKFEIRNGLFTVNGSVIRSAGIDAGNGTIHAISSVIGFSDTCDSRPSDACPSSCDKENADPASPESTGVNGASTTDLITQAIEKGVPLYNSGSIRACADIYENCLTRLSASENLDSQTRDMLKRIARHGRNYDANSRAWLYRHALDRVMQMLALRS